MKKLFFFCCFFLNACAHFPNPENMAYTEVQTPVFTIASWEKITKKGAATHIYIEGDGFAWRNPYTPSSDPTPRKEFLLKLAAADAASNVVYLARPCQYVLSPNCKVDYWTDGRFAPEIIDSMQAAVRKVIEKTKSVNVTLVGYSGGATVAAALAVKVPEVRRLITIAGVLDHEAWTRYHGDSPLKKSIAVSSYKKELARVPQVHYAGENDKTVPPFLIQNFADSLEKPVSARIVVMPGAGHAKGWPKDMPALLVD